MNVNSTIDRPLPHNSEAERAVIAAIFLGSPGIAEAMSQLNPIDFFVPQHRVIYKHVKLLTAKGRPPDTLLVVESLRSSGEIDAAGGPAYLSQIPDGIPRISDIRFYVEILKRKSQLRQSASAVRLRGSCHPRDGSQCER